MVKIEWLNFTHTLLTGKRKSNFDFMTGAIYRKGNPNPFQKSGVAFTFLLKFMLSMFCAHAMKRPLAYCFTLVCLSVFIECMVDVRLTFFPILKLEHFSFTWYLHVYWGWYGVRIIVFIAAFNNISVILVSFIGGGNRHTRRKPLTCQKSLTNFIT